ncbi:MAG: aspartate aminotransferase family protein [Dehalococcoidia bacterium]|nr:aspartate aminotransferase family protein [Dehalococcoidia bacterium]
MAGDAVYSELDRYLETTPRSREMWEEAKRYLPGGDTRNSIFWAPYPIYIQDGGGCHAVDLDGTDRLDFIGNMTSLPLGNAYPPVVKAVQEQAARGLVYNAPNEHQVRLARLLCRRVPSVELVRFTNSGTEATLNAVRAARAFTGRTKIAKCEGGYHGTHDAVSVSVRTDPAMGGSPERPTAVPSVAGLPPSVVEEVVVMPFNDTAAARAILEDNAGELAAVIVEPVLGGSGMVPADQEYLDALREFTELDGSVLIFDEVISFRASHGGAQEHYGIRPDMTTFGKIIGGGFAVGAFGGRRDLMDLYDPTTGPVVGHAGTFNGNPMTMVAGAVTLEDLTPDVYDRLGPLTEGLRQGVRDACAELDVPVRVTGLGSLFGIHFLDRPVRTYRDVHSSDRDLRQRVFWGLMNEGILSTANLVGAVSNPMAQGEVDAFVEAFRTVLARNAG